MAGSDVKTTRVTATGTASIGRCRLLQVLVTSGGSGTPELKLTDGVLYCLESNNRGTRWFFRLPVLQ